LINQKKLMEAIHRLFTNYFHDTEDILIRFIGVNNYFA